LANVVPHLFRLYPEATPSEELPIGDSFLDEKLLAISHQAAPCYANFANFKVCGVLPTGLSHQQRKKSLFDGKYYMWEESLLYKLCRDGVYRRCLPEKCQVSYTIVKLPLMVDILVLGRPLRRFSKLVFTRA